MWMCVRVLQLIVACIQVAIKADNCRIFPFGAVRNLSNNCSARERANLTRDPRDGVSLQIRTPSHVPVILYSRSVKYV
jgi:hypothetical protein